jgi:hypothetical protein
VLAAAGLLLAASLCLAVGVRVLGLAGVAVAVLALGSAVVLGRKPGSRAPFRAVLVVAVVDVALLLMSGTTLG